MMMLKMLLLLINIHANVRACFQRPLVEKNLVVFSFQYFLHIKCGKMKHKFDLNYKLEFRAQVL